MDTLNQKSDPNLAANKIRFFIKHGYQFEDAFRKAIIDNDLETIKYLITQGISFDEAAQLAAKLSRVDIIEYLHEINLIPSEFTQQGLTRLKEMKKEILKSDPIYHPSQFWEEMGSNQEKHLHYGGEVNFKRTINQSYFNFVPNSQNEDLLSFLAKKLEDNKIDINHLKSEYTIMDPDNDPILWFSFYSDYHIFKGEREFKLELYKQFVVQMYEYIFTTPEKSILETLEEPELGNPIKIYYKNKRIAQDLATSVMERASILSAIKYHEKPRDFYKIAELGAGYGRLGYVFLKTIPCKYVVFDIPPALYVSEWYLSNLFPDKKIFKFRPFEYFHEIKAELENADIAFFTSNQLEQFPPNYFDIFINISSLHEMTRQQIKHFMQLMQAKTNEILYLKQYWNYINPHDNLKIIDTDYTLEDTFQQLKKNQDALNPLFFEMIARKNKHSNVSILLSNYNHAQYLPESLEAICSQTLSPMEVVIIDDGLTDNSVSVIQEFQKRFPYIKLFINEQNKGLMFSISLALNEAKGDYIVWAASDDKLLPNFIEENVNVLTKYPEAGLSFSQLAVFDDITKIERHYSKEKYGLAFDLQNEPQFLSPKELFNRLDQSYLWMSGNTVVVRRDLIHKYGGFPESLRWHSEWFIFYVIALRHGACSLPDTLAMMRERQNTYSNTGMHNSKQQRQVLQSLASIIYSPQYGDLYPIFLKRPCLLSPFGKKMIWALLSNRKHWRLFCAHFYWYVFKHYKYHLWPYRRLKRLLHRVLVNILAFARYIYHRTNFIADYINKKTSSVFRFFYRMAYATARFCYRLTRRTARYLLKPKSNKNI